MNALCDYKALILRRVTLDHLIEKYAPWHLNETLGAPLSGSCLQYMASGSFVHLRCARNELVRLYWERERVAQA